MQRRGGCTSFATFNFNPFNVFQTPFKRFNIFAQGNYEVSDAVEVYTRGMFSKNTVDTIIAPSGSFGGTVTINLNNPICPRLRTSSARSTLRVNRADRQPDAIRRASARPNVRMLNRDRVGPIRNDREVTGALQPSYA